MKKQLLVTVYEADSSEWLTKFGLQLKQGNTLVNYVGLIKQLVLEWNGDPEPVQLSHEVNEERMSISVHVAFKDSDTCEMVEEKYVAWFEEINFYD